MSSEDNHKDNPESEQPEEQLESSQVENTGDCGENPASGTDNPGDIEALTEQLAAANEKALRAAAEVQNIQRRAQMDVEKAHKYALEKFSSDLLAVIDNLERALQAADGENDALKPVVEGIELTLKSFLDTMSKHGVEQIDPHGEPFDPNFHQAITMVPNPELEPNTVMDVMQKGYLLSGRLLRPAMVVVSKSS